MGALPPTHHRRRCNHWFTLIFPNLFWRLLLRRSRLLLNLLLLLLLYLQLFSDNVLLSLQVIVTHPFVFPGKVDTLVQWTEASGVFLCVDIVVVSWSAIAVEVDHYYVAWGTIALQLWFAGCAYLIWGLLDGLYYLHLRIAGIVLTFAGVIIIRQRNRLNLLLFLLIPLFVRWSWLTTLRLHRWIMSINFQAIRPLFALLTCLNRLVLGRIHFHLHGFSYLVYD